MERAIPQYDSNFYKGAPMTQDEKQEKAGVREYYDGKLLPVLNPERSGWWRFHNHYDSQGYCDNPDRGY